MVVATQTETQSSSSGTLKLRGAAIGMDIQAEVERNGYAVVPGVLSSERAQHYVDRAYSWLESFNKGFNRNDRSTWTPENLPYFEKGGLFNRYASGHEQFAWDIRSEPALIDVFAQIWGTDELLVSFDGVNVSLPFDKAAPVDRAPWPHVDQSPNRRFKHCVQGIMNLCNLWKYDNGPKDGGLMVLEGSYPLYNEFFETHEDQAPPGGWKWIDSYHFEKEQLEWFYEKGCKWKKVEAKAGDVILWDSRMIHYGAAAEGDIPRIATYVCYKPAKLSSPEQNELRKECIKNYDNTSHDPIFFRPTGTRIRGPVAPDEICIPKQPAVLSDRAKQLAGILSY